ncbi:MAG: PfkB family carbohydrate kinase [Planctomycetota bacterium]
MDARDRTRAKVVSRAELLAARAAAREAGRSLVQCHGCFDIVHPGHVRHLHHAARQGDLLLVSITADTGVNKGAGRPLFTQDLRAENLAALDCVDLVYVNPDPTAERLLDEVRPDVYIKGREYEGNEDPRFAAERTAVEQHGGRVVFSSGDVVFSSTALVEAIHAGSAIGELDREDPARARIRQLAARYDLTPPHLAALVDGMSDRRVVVVGETIIDTYIRCDRPDAAGEAPVLSLRPIEEASFDGGAAIIAQHAAAMGADVTLVTALPMTVEAAALRDRLEAAAVHVEAVTTEVPLARKDRYLVGSQKVMKVDRVGSLDLDSRARAELVEIASDVADASDAAILADFGLGMMSPRLVAELGAALRPRVRILAGDVSGRRSALLSMREADLLTPSESELRDALHDYDSSLPAVAWELMRRTSARTLATTLGPDGVIAFERRAGAESERGWSSRLTSEHVPALNPHPLDELGCGDAMLAATVLALASGAEVPVASYLGSLAAAEQAARLGNHPISAAMLIDAARRADSARVVVRTTNTPTRLAGTA